MTLDDAIKHAEEVVEGHEKIKCIKAVTLEECKRTEEYRQLAEWLKELKQLREQEFCVTMRELSDDELKHLVEQMKKERLQLILVEQKSSEDCISRQMALDTIQKLNIPEDMCVFEIKSHIEVKIATLPSVTPQQTPGRWINDKCSVCGKGIEDLISSPEWYRNEQPNFCPFCGIQIESKD